ncbi:hypothetical protein RHOSPDRAFT_34174 [Rhodotorula sp. JG-1b]|nr:hypothetical protein RHOSPDRAFT_34174 [Rhodotorula sp. JG-1b]
MASTHSNPLTTCSQCFQGSRLQGEPKGNMVRDRLGGLEYYLAKGGEAAKDSKAIVLGTDIFGLGLPNPKIMADLFAERTRLDVYVPDYFQGEYMDEKELKPPGGGGPTPLAQEWRKKYSINNVRPGVEAFCRALKTEKGYKRLGFVGYCYGGVLSILLAAEQSPTDVSVCAHPGKLDLADFENVRKPVAIVLAEQDHIFDDQKPAALAILDRIQSEHAVPIAIYDQHAATTHGFGCRPDLENEAVKTAWEKAAEETVVKQEIQATPRNTPTYLELEELRDDLETKIKELKGDVVRLRRDIRSGKRAVARRQKRLEQVAACYGSKDEIMPIMDEVIPRS